MSTIHSCNNAKLPDAGLVMLSIIIPFLNEQEVLPHCHARLSSILNEMGGSYEILYVDDGSSDDSVAMLVNITRDSTQTKIIRLSRNFGKEAAMSAGLAHASGAAVIVLDADLQDPPELIPEMVAAWKAGADVVAMRRRFRDGEGWFKRLSAYAFYRILNRLSRPPVPADTGDFRLMSRRVVDILLQLPERCRYMKGLYSWIGFPTTFIEYDRERRAAGKTKWNYLSLLGLAFEGITSFSTKPLRCATIIGAFAALLGGSFGLWIIFKTIFFGENVPGYPSMISAITLLSGIQLLTIGLLGEYVGKSYTEVKQRPIFIVRDVIDPSAKNVVDFRAGRGDGIVN
ncbi:glycosyltransferase family 2 protein [Alcaligenes phenolicus]|uniref:Glycosyltransferase family 2 protein n=1 Tax=Alcaligenes phenolicus TaxID=232846 RepID=A0AAW5W0X1_9BURK|nr:glycosyltransferase family 2 protein [Alcaligenes phenolicus]MCX5566047.1 glycosyltransferase family 2 protein [Alcaligenes phenolicus]